MNRSLSDFDPALLKTRREMFPNLFGKIFLTISETSNWTLLDTVQIYSTENFSTASFDNKMKR